MGQRRNEMKEEQRRKIQLDNRHIREETKRRRRKITILSVAATVILVFLLVNLSMIIEFLTMPEEPGQLYWARGGSIGQTAQGIPVLPVLITFTSIWIIIEAVLLFFLVHTIRNKRL